MKVMELAKVAEYWFRGLNEVNEHHLKSVAMELMQGNLRFVVSQRLARTSHNIHLPLLLVTDLVVHVCIDKKANLILMEKGLSIDASFVQLFGEIISSSTGLAFTVFFFMAIHYLARTL